MDFQFARRTMADNQIRTYDVTNVPLLAAFETVPREAFVLPEQRAIAYSDLPVVIQAGESTRTLMPPLVAARMLQAADITADDKALIVGGATGYLAAIVATIARQVFLIEDNDSIIAMAKTALREAGSDHVNVIKGALAHGHAGAAPYTLIVVEGAVEAAPETLLSQLADGGRLLCVVGNGRAGRVTLFTKRGGSVSGRIVFDAAVPALADFRQQSGFVF